MTVTNCAKSFYALMGGLVNSLVDWMKLPTMTKQFWELGCCYSGPLSLRSAALNSKKQNSHA